MTNSIHVTLALPLADELLEQLRTVDSRLSFTALTAAQRRSYRGGRPLWGGYGDAPASDEESAEEAAAALAPILQRTEVLLCNPIVPEDLIERASGLRWLQLSSAGIDRLGRDPCLRVHQSQRLESDLDQRHRRSQRRDQQLRRAKG